MVAVGLSTSSWNKWHGNGTRLTGRRDSAPAIGRAATVSGDRVGRRRDAGRPENPVARRKWSPPGPGETLYFDDYRPRRRCRGRARDVPDYATQASCFAARQSSTPPRASTSRGAVPRSRSSLRPTPIGAGVMVDGFRIPAPMKFRIHGRRTSDFTGDELRISRASRRRLLA